MNLRALIFPSLTSSRASAGLLVLRLVAGCSMATHGWGKIQNPFHWMDKVANPPPAFFQFLAAVAEFCGGLGLALGAVTAIASFGVMCTMVVAINHHVSSGDAHGKWELASLYLAISTLLLLAGPGKFSIDALVQRRMPNLGGVGVAAG